MKKILLFTLLNFVLLGVHSCKHSKPTESNKKTSKSSNTNEEMITNIESFIPKGYTLIEETATDLNKDNEVDYILFIKGTDKKNLFKMKIVEN